MEAKAKHTPGPIETVGATRIWSQKGAIAIVAEPECKDSSDFSEVKIGSPRWKEAMANADRILACWNGCEGIKNPEAVRDLLKVLQSELEALKEDIRESGACDHSANHCICPLIGRANRISDAIAKAKGEA